MKSRVFINSSKQQLIAAFEELKEKLLTLTTDLLEKIVLEYFDYISWLESKIKNRNFSDIVKEKNIKLQDP